MCSAPKMPPPPPPPQEVKQPDSMAQRRARRPQGMGGGTMLTGPSGVGAGALNTGGASLLGG